MLKAFKKALARRCPICGAAPGKWCLRRKGKEFMHGMRLEVSNET